ncbi:hypothetical protein D6821_00395 [Candidatus Parcubacteria bacterium]|nr:MAG: hypothetical protein D6821_00395 [Candidatus Parcubacteria bacterium]
MDNQFSPPPTSPFPSQPPRKPWWVKILLIIGGILLSIFVAFIFLAIDAYRQFNQTNIPQPNNQTGLSQEFIQTLDNPTSPYLGKKDARIAIIEFGDFGCPSCKNFYPKLKRAVQEYPEKVRVVFRDFPVIQEFSPQLALAARCAGEQGLFWAMHDTLFDQQNYIYQNQQNLSSVLNELAAKIGVETNRFNQCMQQKKYLPSIQKDYQDGLKLDIKGTPTWFINGYKVSGDVPWTVLKKTIEEILNRK